MVCVNLLVEQSRKAAEKIKTSLSYNFLTHFWVTLKGNCNMNKKDKKKFDQHYKQLLKCLKLQGKADNTIDSYSRAYQINWHPMI